MAAALTPNALTVLERRYLRRDAQGRVIETPEAMVRRVARNVAEADRLYEPGADLEATAQAFYQVMADLEFLPNSPTLMNAGRELQQLAACFVLPVEDSLDSIFEAVKYTAIIHKSGGGTGFSFSRLRPQADPVDTTSGIASGPVSFMKVFNTATEVIKQGGTRRGANMGILRVDHPDILQFIDCKRGTQELSNFNISVGVTDRFLQALAEGGSYPLINPRTGQPVRELQARAVFDRLVEAAWEGGEPGMIFLDEINRWNPTPQLGEIEATNPCGEQPLLPRAQGGRVVLERDKLARTIRTAVHFLDNVIDMSRYPVPQITAMCQGNRKIGLGVMGFADLLIRLGIPYDSEQALRYAEELMAFVSQTARAASAELAERRGSFPNFKGSRLEREGKAPLRNAAVTTVAPTGTLSLIAGCSSGIEPLYGIAFVRRVLDGERLAEVNPYFVEVVQQEGLWSEGLRQEIEATGRLPAAVPAAVRQLFVTAFEVAPEWHVRMQAAFQRSTDSAVSKTVNLPAQATREDVARVFLLAHELKCKGVTVFRSGGRPEQVLTCGTLQPC
ncbi:MAG: adenosylcobalamin-dependent ribonucleoside-diphosphate reductase [Deltaproteobacteria bacterium]|nr:adenosylcobalamin-dependent ribonucleoside-diphosphate reductase [Deltaproteobacteria bacterium]